MVQNKKLQREVQQNGVKYQELDLVKNKYNQDLIQLEKESYQLQLRIDKFEQEKSENEDDKQSLLDYIKEL